MLETDALLSALVDQALAAELIPWACPCDFGPADRYRLLEVVGAGPQALVYRATDRHLSSEGFEAPVAVKVLRGTGHARSEALAARRISHKHVVGIVDRGELEDGTQYIVSEFVDGGDLADLPLPLPAHQAAALIAKLAGAVQAAHSAGIVHCDIKPSNVLLTAEKEPKLCDFGLSRWATDDQGHIRGNSAFMSPEQHAGSDAALTPPSDIYALGGLLYHLLTGELPHGATADEVTTFHAAARQIPAPPVERDLERICRKATARDRDQRYHSAGELGEDLNRWLRHEPLAWTKPSLLRRSALSARRRPVHAITLIVLLTASAAAVGTWRYNVALDRERLLESQARGIRIAAEEVAATRAKARKLIEGWAQRVEDSMQGSDPNDAMFSTLTWIEWLGGAPVLLSDGGIPAADDRARLLRSHIAVTSAAGDARLDTLMSKYALAQLHIMLGESEEAAPLVADLNRDLLPRLSPNDPLRPALDALSVCVAFLRASPEDLPSARQALAAADAKLAVHKGVDAVRRLTDKVAAKRPVVRQKK